jgi:hypothetical protein
VDETISVNMVAVALHGNRKIKEEEGLGSVTGGEEDVYPPFGPLPYVVNDEETNVPNDSIDHSDAVAHVNTDAVAHVNAADDTVPVSDVANSAVANDAIVNSEANDVEAKVADQIPFLYRNRWHPSAEKEAEKRGKKLPATGEDAKRLIEEEHRLGHFGRDAMVMSLNKSGWWWPGLAQDVNAHLAQCDECLAFNVQKKGFEPFHFVTASTPWQRVQVDTAHMPASYPDNLVGFLCITDVFTGFTILRAVKDLEATTIGNELWQVFCLFGFPEKLQSDNGPEFANEVVRVLCKLAGVEPCRTTAYNSRGNGLVEVDIGIVKRMLHKECMGASVLWPKYIHFVQLCFNMHVSSRTKSRSFSLMFARNARAPIAQEYAPIVNEPFDAEKVVKSWENDHSPYREYVRKVMSVIVPAIERRTLEVKQGMVARLNALNRTLVNKPIPIGTEVWLENRLDPLPEGSPRYLGPYWVTSAGAYGTYHLADATNTLYPSAVKRDMLKVRSLLKKRVQLDSAVEVHRDEEQIAFVPIDNATLMKRVRHDKRYEVEKLMEHLPADDGGKGYKYKVRWVGYGPGHDSWVDAEDLNAPVLLRAYWASQEKNPGKAKK